MRKEEENILKEKIDTQIEIISNCFNIYKDLDFLIHEQSSDIEKILEGDLFFTRVADYMWRILIIELNKLYNKNEGNYKIETTLNFIENNYMRIKWETIIQKEKILELKSFLQNPEINKIIETLDYLRDRYIAHLDRNRFKQDVRLYLQDCKKLLDIGQEILSTLSRLLWGYGQILDCNFNGLCQFTVLKLVEYNKNYKLIKK